jgi:glycogen operon protein
LIRGNKDILDFCKKTIAFRKRYPVLQRRKFFLGKDTADNHILDISWFTTNLKNPTWDDHELRTICYQLDGAEKVDKPGNYLLFLILNADSSLKTVHLPKHQNRAWYRIVDTSLPAGEDFLSPGYEMSIKVTDTYIVNPRTIVVLLGK